MPDNEVWSIYFEDASMPPEVFDGECADAAAIKRFAELSHAWKVTLFRSVDPDVLNATGACECPTRAVLRETACWLCRVKYGDTPPTYASGMPCPDCEDQRAALVAPCPCAGMRQERDEAKSEAAARLKQLLTQTEIHTKKTQEWRVALDAAEAERSRLSAELGSLRVNISLATLAMPDRDETTDEDRIDWLYAQITAETERAEANWQSLERVKGKFETATAQLAASQERERQLREKLERVYRIASGEDQVADDDTEGMAVIAALATPEGTK